MIEKTKKTLQFLGIVFCLFVTISILLELYAHKKCVELGIEKTGYYYGMKANPFYATMNTPNFEHEALDGNSNFLSGSIATDSNSFICNEPISRNKPNNTIRIFIAGGSTAYGSMQNKYFIDEVYPEGVYTYESSIAGLLRKKLQGLFPKTHIQVINAAVPGHRFYQTYLMYLTKLRWFSPDVIVNIHGNNDGQSMFLADDFEISGTGFNEFIDREAKARQVHFPYVLLYGNYLREKYFQQITKPIKNTTVDVTKPVSFNEYKKIEPFLIRSSQNLIWSINAYNEQLKKDSVCSILILQPILERRINKKLSSIENRFRNDIEKCMVPDEQMMGNLKQSGFNTLGDRLPQLYNITYSYFFDNYLTLVEDSISRSTNSVYIDMNKQMGTLIAENQFYMDYCHLTPFGNDYTATLLSEKISSIIKTKKLHQ